MAAALAALAVAAGCRRATPTPAPSPTAAPPTATVAPSPRPSGTVAAPAADVATPTAAVVDAATPAADAATATAAATSDAGLPDAGALLDKRLEGGAVGGTYHLDDVRTGRHDGFTRIVWAMAEAEGAPRWTALLRRDVEGTATIDVTLADVSAVDKPAEVAAQAVDSPIVDSVQPRRVPDDAVLAFRVRLAHPAGYRVTVLEAPVRVVLDVAHGP